MGEPATSYLNQMVLPQGMVLTELSVPNMQLYHYITDTDLERLGDMRKEPVMEICLASIGVFMGSILPTIEQISRFNASTNAMGLVGLATCLISFGSLAISVVTAFLWYRRSGNHKNLLDSIRARPRVRVLSNDNTA